MSALVYAAAPYAPPPPPAPPWVGYTMTWTGPDGAAWPLDGSTGVLLLQDGLVGLHIPEHDRYTSTAPSIAGSRHRGSRAQERDVEWNLLVYSDASSEAWLELDRAFWSSFDTDDPGVWTVSDLNGRALSLECRLTPKNDPYARDPSLFGWNLYNVQMVAGDPFWRGAPIERSWHNSTPVAFFDPAGSPSFHISSAATLATAQLDNPGAASAWLAYEFVGPLTDISITMNDGTIEPPDVADGSTLLVNTDPQVASVLLDGADVFYTVGAWDPRPLPKSASTLLTIAATGTGTISATFTPRYRRGI